MRALETYQSNAAESGVMRKWLFGGLILSLLFHAGLLLCFQNAKLERFSDAPPEQRLVPTAFHATRVDIPEKLLDSDKSPPQPLVTMPSTLRNIETPDEKPFEDLKATPVAPQPLKPIVPANDKLDMSKLQAAQQMEQKENHSIDQDIDPAIRSQLIKDSPEISNAPKLRLRDDGSSGSAIPKGFQSIDQALSSSGTRNAKTGPILMPTDLLFDYDKSELRDRAVSSLEKLGKLIQSNPRAVFSIEGYTDSHGPLDYNQSLSLRRAESVKQWLVASMGIDASRIQTKGYGSTKLIAPANGDVQKEQINRRVEIVIHQHAAKVIPATE